MSQIGPIIAAAASHALKYSERLLAGIPAEQFARYARPGGVEIKSNHPAFVFGHLATYPRQVVSLLGVAAGQTALPESYDALFKHGIECQDDPTGRIYPPMTEITAKFFEASRAAIGAAAGADDAVYARPNPAEGRIREMFPTIGAVVNFYLCAHPQSHLGQVSAWRRAIGLPPA